MYAKTLLVAHIVALYFNIIRAYFAFLSNFTRPLTCVSNYFLKIEDYGIEN